MKEFVAFLDKMTAIRTIFLYYDFYICIDSVFICQSIPSTAFVELHQYFTYTMSTNLTYAYSSLVGENEFLTK